MKNLKKSELDKIYSNNKNLTDKPIFIDFYADWWGPCKVFEQVLNKVVPNYTNKINAYKVDISKEENLASVFEARSIPYMIFITKEGVVSSLTGSLDEDTLRYYFEGLISKK